MAGICKAVPSYIQLLLLVEFVLQRFETFTPCTKHCHLSFAIYSVPKYHFRRIHPRSDSFMTLKRKYSSVHTASTQTTIAPFSEQRYHMGAKHSTQATQKRKKSTQQLQQYNIFQIPADPPQACPQSLASLSKRASSHGSFYSE